MKTSSAASPLRYKRDRESPDVTFVVVTNRHSDNRGSKGYSEKKKLYRPDEARRTAAADVSKPT